MGHWLELGQVPFLKQGCLLEVVGNGGQNTVAAVVASAGSTLVDGLHREPLACPVVVEDQGMAQEDLASSNHHSDLDQGTL